MINNQKKINNILLISWLILLTSCFFRESIPLFTIEGVGLIYLFRVMTPIVFLCFCFVSYKDRSFICNSFLYKLVYGLLFSLLLYSVFSIFIAIDLSFTISRVFNFSLVLLFCFIGINLFKTYYIESMRLVCFLIVFILSCAIYETMFSGIFTSLDGTGRVFSIFGNVLNTPLLYFGNINDLASSIAMVVVVTSWHLIVYRKSSHVFKNMVQLYLFVFVINLSTLYVALCALSNISYFCTFVNGVLIFVFILMNEKKHKFIVISFVVGLLLLNGFSMMQNGDNFYDLFFDEQNQLNLESTGGIRLTLIEYCFTTMSDSKMLGVGIGNTEVLAARDNIIEVWSGNDHISMHSFCLRLASDAGLFFLVPLIAIATYIIKNSLRLFKGSHAKTYFNYIISIITPFLLFVVLTFNSSDAQDLVLMWVSVIMFILLFNDHDVVECLK